MARLYARSLGEGHPVIVLHGGPDFDHTYLLPEMDRLAAHCRLIYYDQRGRGRSTGTPDEIDIASEVADVERVRAHFGLNGVAVLGHSWGALLAAEYAIRHPNRVSHLVIMDSGPISHGELHLERDHIRSLRTEAEAEAMQRLSSTAAFQQGDLAVEAEYYRIHFRPAFADEVLLDDLVGRLRTHFTEEGVLRARAIEERLYADTWDSPEYDLAPALRRLDVPTLVVHGENDPIPIDIAAVIAGAVPGARLEVLDRCGHFPHIECPDALFSILAVFFGGS
jgi:proline iminopeptidase